VVGGAVGEALRAAAGEGQDEAVEVLLRYACEEGDLRGALQVVRERRFVYAIKMLEARLGGGEGTVGAELGPLPTAGGSAMDRLM
jgi:hypothetical protein